MHQQQVEPLVITCSTFVIVRFVGNFDTSKLQRMCSGTCSGNMYSQIWACMMICSVLTKEAMIHGMQWMFSTRGDNASEKKIKISESSAVHRKDQRAKRQSHRGSFVKLSSSPCDFNTSCQAQHLQKNTKKPNGLSMSLALGWCSRWAKNLSQDVSDIICQLDFCFHSFVPNTRSLDWERFCISPLSNRKP